MAERASRGTYEGDRSQETLDRMCGVLIKTALEGRIDGDKPTLDDLVTLRSIELLAKAVMREIASDVHAATTLTWDDIGSALGMTGANAHFQLSGQARPRRPQLPSR